MVPQALPPSFMEPSGSVGSNLGVDGVSSRSPRVAPSPSSLSRRASAPSVSRPSLLVSRLGHGLGRPSRLSGRFGPVGHPSGSVVYQRQGTASCSAGAFPVPFSSPRSHSDCLLRRHHSGDFPSQEGWHLVSSPQHLGSGDLALDGVPLHPPGSTVPSGLLRLQLDDVHRQLQVNLEISKRDVPLKSRCPSLHIIFVDRRLLHIESPLLMLPPLVLIQQRCVDPCPGRLRSPLHDSSRTIDAYSSHHRFSSCSHERYDQRVAYSDVPVH